ncbi:LysE family translocator [Metabacillus arenae]|uniref:LysE family translocator n=1 Tax=Metabacillus arenae TaxID=2771434 RepID=A0A926RXM2_9BACI|nr:LysE family translocator [Metabacillus arenae]MBD1381136.1 LysE family translocator [Metabacillus arenae]
MEQLYLFIFMSICLIILPGPDTAIATKNVLTAGKMGGLKTVIGTCCAICIHTLAAVVGLSAIIVKSAFLFSIIKYVGAIYLVYLGCRALWSIKGKEPEPASEISENQNGTNVSYFRQGFLTNLLNPKVAVFFLTFLPQFVNQQSDPFGPFLLMGLIYTVLTALWFFLYLFLIHQISAFMKKSSTQKMIQGITGFVLIGFGIKLAMERHR